MVWYKIASITTAGANGSATGTSGIVGKDVDSGQQIPSGFIFGEFVDFTTMPATTDVTISRILPNSALSTLLTLTNTNTDGRYNVKEFSSGNTGVASTTDLIYPRSPNGLFQVDVAQGDAITNGVIVWLDIEPW